MGEQGIFMFVTNKSDDLLQQTSMKLVFYGSLLIPGKLIAQQLYYKSTLPCQLKKIYNFNGVNDFNIIWSRVGSNKPQSAHSTTLRSS